MKRRVISWLLCISMLLGVAPAALAASEDILQPKDRSYGFGSESEGSGEDITLHKTAAENEDGTYTVTLSASAKETVSIQPTEVVFLLDTSGSMNYCADGEGKDCDHREGSIYCERVEQGKTPSRLTQAKAAIRTVVGNLSETQDNTVHYAYFGGHYNGWEWVYDAEATDSYDQINKGNGGTPLTLGTEKALEQFTQVGSSHVLIIVADGESDDGYPTEAIRKFKAEGGTVYTVGFTFSSSDFTALASPNGSYTANNANELKIVMNEITTKVAGLISDPMGDGVDLVLDGDNTVLVSGEGYENSNVWLSEDHRTIYWNNANGLSRQVTLTYRVRLNGTGAKESEPYEIPLNRDAMLNYHYDGTMIRDAFPIPVAQITPKPEQVTLTYESCGGTAFDPEHYDKGTEAILDKTPEKPGFTFRGWYLDEALTQPVTKVTMDADRTVYAKWEEDKTPDLDKGDHSAYIIGYTDGTVRPYRNITRAEVATIFFRLLTEESRQAHWASTNAYTDVQDSDWCNNAISTLTNMGILKGYSDGTFRPGEPVTRAQFAVIAARFCSQAVEGTASFSDVPADYWAAKEIVKAEQLGWIKGYSDGTFRPGKNITRAETMTLVNRVLERVVDQDGIHPDVMNWSDNPNTGKWPYYEVQEATNSHEYMRTDRYPEGQSFSYEKWTQMKENRDWAALEKQWKQENEAR